jgi:hypothetical protein
MYDPQPVFLSLHGNYVWHLRFLSMGHRLWGEDMFVIYGYNCYCASPALSLSDPSLVERETISYCHIWDWVPFLSPLTIRSATSSRYITGTNRSGNDCSNNACAPVAEGKCPQISSLTAAVLSSACRVVTWLLCLHVPVFKLETEA